jgi:hypothetical protein
MRKALRAAELALAFGGALSFAASWLMRFWMDRVMPTHPDPQTGFVIPMISHGQTIYISWAYDFAFTLLAWVGATLFLAAVIIDFYKDPFDRQKRGKA